MLRASAILALLWIFPALAPAQQPAPTSDRSLRAYTLKIQDRQAYGVYLANQKVGWMIEETRLGTHNGREVAIDSEESYIALKLSREKSIKTSKSITCFSLEGDGPIVFAEEREVEDGYLTVRRAVPEGRGMLLTSHTKSGEKQRHVPVPKETLALSRRLDEWLSATPAKGARFESYTTSWDEADINTKETVTFQEKKKILWGGVPLVVCLVQMEVQGARMNAELKANGTPLRNTLGGLLEMRAEEEVVAKKLGDKPVDMLKASEVPVDRELGDPRNVRSLALEVSDAGEFTFPTCPRQKARRQEDKIVLDLLPDFRVEQAEALPAQQRADCLAATPSIQCDEERVRRLARKIVGAEKDPVRAAKLLEKWVHDNLRKTMAVNGSTALQILDNLAGDCTEHTLLFVSLARAAGIPAREVGGLAYPDIGRPVFGWHAWAEIHDGRQWVSVDPTWGEFYVDATHIKFQEGSDDFAWMNVAGKIKLRVLRLTSDN
jgi:hypothetical protein